MTKIYVLTISDGCAVQGVELFTEVEKANEVMRGRYVGVCEECGIEEPFEKHNFDCGFEENHFAYVEGECYMDIFEREI